MSALSKKIVHIISSLETGGRERQLATIVSNCDLDKFPTKIIYFNTTKRDYFDEYQLRSLSIKVEARKIIPRLIELNRILRQEKPDIVYTWGNTESIFMLALKSFHPFVFINGSVRHGIRSRQVSHYLRTCVLHLSANVVANSNAGLKANGLKKGWVLYNGVDEKFFNVKSASKRVAEFKTGLISPVIISVANLVPYKDYFTVLDALAKLKNKGKPYTYLIIGDGPMRDEIKAYIRLKALSDQVYLMGAKRNVLDYLKSSDIFIHSSKGEGCSNAILEAMAAGLPIIATDTGGTSEIISEENGFLCEYKNVAQLECRLETCLDDHKLREKLGENSIKKIKNHFAVPIMIKNFYNILSQISKIRPL